MCRVTGVNCAEIKTEADSNDVMEYPGDDKPITGVCECDFLLCHFICFDYVCANILILV